MRRRNGRCRLPTGRQPCTGSAFCGRSECRRRSNADGGGLGGFCAGEGFGQFTPGAGGLRHFGEVAAERQRSLSRVLSDSPGGRQGCFSWRSAQEHLSLFFLWRGWQRVGLGGATGAVLAAGSSAPVTAAVPGDGIDGSGAGRSCPGPINWLRKKERQTRRFHLV